MPQNMPRDEKTLLREIESLKKRVKSLETSPRTGNASVSHGKFLVQDGESGTQLLRIGYLGNGDFGEIRGTAMRRPTGEYAFATWSGSGGDDGGFWAWYDKADNTIISDDVTSGQGLATPYIGAPLFAPGDTSKWPAVTSSSYAGQWYAVWYKQHPRLHLSVWTQTASGTSGDIRASCNGASVSQSVGSNDNSTRDFYLTVPGAHLSTFQVVIEMRRTSGTGFMGCWPMSAEGVQSPG